MNAKGNPIPEAGNKYGRWTVIEKRGIDRNGSTNWLCRCECGKEGVVPGTRLRANKSKGCGCVHVHGRIEEGKAAFNRIYKMYQRNAMTRNLKFNIGEKEFKELIGKECWYCGKLPSQVQKAKWSNYTYNGIDRVNNEKGYVSGNVVPCCKRCNRAKDTQSLDEFLEWALAIAERHVCG